MKEDTAQGKHYSAVRSIQNSVEKFEREIQKEIEERISAFSEEEGLTVKYISMKIFKDENISDHVERTVNVRIGVYS